MANDVKFTEVRKAFNDAFTMTAERSDAFRSLIELSEGRPEFFVFAAMSTLRMAAINGIISDKNVKDAMTMLGIARALNNKSLELKKALEEQENNKNNQEELSDESPTGSVDPV